MRCSFCRYGIPVRSCVVCDVTAGALGGNGGWRETVGAEQEKMSESEREATLIKGRLLQ